MSLFEDASLIITPNGRKAGKIYALKPFNGSGDLTVVRATMATEVNSSGVIVDVASNVARFDYTNGSCPSILVEPQRTNLVFPSATATTQSRTVTAVAHTLSFYGTGSITLSGVATGTLVGTGVSNRVTLTFTPTAGSLTLTVTGSVTNWQLEAGLNATSLIKTTVSAVTRNADVISKTGISDLIGQSQGTVFADFNITNNDLSSNKTIISLDDNSYYVNMILARILNTNTLNIFFRTGAISISFSNMPVISNGNHKIAIRYGNGFASVFVDGIFRNTQVWTNSFTNSISQLFVGKNRLETPYFNDTINSVALWKTALTDEQCISLTT